MNPLLMEQDPRPRATEQSLPTMSVSTQSFSRGRGSPALVSLQRAEAALATRGRAGLRKAGGGPQAWEGCSAPHYLRRLSSGWGLQAPRPPRSLGDSQDIQTWTDRLSGCAVHSYCPSLTHPHS